MKPHLNFSPQPFVQRQTIIPALALINLVLLVACVGSLYFWWTLKQVEQKQTTALSEMEDQRQSLRTQFEKIQMELNNIDLRSYDRNLKFFAQIQLTMNTPWVHLLDLLGSHMPDGVRVQVFASEGDHSKSSNQQLLHVTALARSKTDQLKFLDSLRQDPSIKHVLLLNEVYEGSELQFEFTFQFEEVTHG